MKCDVDCKWDDEASVFFSYIENGKMVKVNLCKHCANEKGITDPTSYQLIDVLQGMGVESESPSAKGLSASSPLDELICEKCGFTQSDFKKTGRFGCAHCYQVFSEGLESLLEAMHKKTEHIGKVPSFFDDKKKTKPVSVSAEISDLDDLNFDFETVEEMDDFSEPVEMAGPVELGESPDLKIAELKDQLDLAISEEDYEEAARIRDEISKLDQENHL